MCDLVGLLVAWLSCVTVVWCAYSRESDILAKLLCKGSKVYFYPYNLLCFFLDESLNAEATKM